jgi:hypothetical protein
MTLTEEPASQLPSCGMLPLTNTFSPYTVDTVDANVTGTAAGLIVWPTRMAIAPRAGTVAKNVPELDTVNLTTLSTPPLSVCSKD